MGIVAPETSRTIACPQCGASCPDQPGFVTWCDVCNWNVTPTAPPRSGGARRRLGRWMGASLLATGGRSTTDRLFRAAAFGYATLVYAVLLGLLFGGIALGVLGFPNPFAILGAVIMVGSAYVARPRATPVPSGIADREQFAAVYALAEQIAGELGAHHVDAIVITDEFNAHFGRFGVRGRRVMGLGLPLVTVLTAQQRVALIAHEIAHDVNGDPARGRYVGNAYRALLELHGLLRPVNRQASDAWGTVRTAEVQMGAGITNSLMRFVSLITRPLVIAMEVLMRRDSQRAEYLADALAADVAGADAALGLLRVTHLAPLLGATANAMVTAPGEQDDLFGRLRRRVADTPAREWERIDRVMALEETQLDSSHPPTAQRIRVIEGRPHAEPRVVLDQEGTDAIDLELLPLERPYARELVERAHDRLYR